MNWKKPMPCVTETGLKFKDFTEELITYNPYSEKLESTFPDNDF